MQSPTVTRGRLTIPKTSEFREFMFNPNELDDDKGVNYGELQVLGASHPVVQFGSGGARSIAFQLFLDGDRGRVGRAVPNGGGKDVQQMLTPTEGLNINDEIRWYRSLLYPAEYDAQLYSAVYPYIVLLTFGQYVRQLPCLVRRASVRVNYWTPQLEPVRATVDMLLTEVVNRSQTASSVRNTRDIDLFLRGGG